MADYGLEVLIGISRFWSQRTTFSENLKKYVILGVTGPNEYENNVNNNWYTNSLAVWTLSYTLKNIEILEKETPDKLKALFKRQILIILRKQQDGRTLSITCTFPCR